MITIVVTVVIVVGVGVVVVVVLSYLWVCSFIFVWVFFPCSYSNPVPLMPGDVIKTTCVYNTEYKTKTIFFGESTAEEMCFGFIYYYPMQV